MTTAREWLNAVDERDVNRRILHATTDVPAMAAALRAVLDRCREALDENRPPNATNAEVVWLVEDLLNGIDAALGTVTP